MTILTSHIQPVLDTKRIPAALLAGICAALLISTAAHADATKPHVDTSGQNMQPNYPATALAAKEVGEVLLDVVVAPNGTVEKIALRHSTGFNDLDRVAIGAVMDWHFIPATDGGKPVEGVTTIALAFAPPGMEDQVPKTVPARDFLPAMISLEAPAGMYEPRDFALPCDNGMVTTSVKLVAPANRRATTEYALSASIIFGTGDMSGKMGTGEAVSLAAMVGYWSQYDFSLVHWDASHTVDNRHHFKNGGMSTLGVMAGETVPLWLSWDSWGNVSTTVGTEHTSMKLAKAPDTAQIMTSGAKADFQNTTLICTPPNKS